MRKALLLLLSLFVITLFGGCGDSDEFSGSTVQNNNFISLLPNLSGNVGGFQLLTSLEDVNPQSISIVNSAVVPEVVDEFRFLGFNEEGILIYGPVIRDKAAGILLDQVPVEVVNMRIELLAGGLIVGGWAGGVEITTGQTFVLNNPTFSFPQGATGAAGPTGATGATGDTGETGPPGEVTSAYGSYRGFFEEAGFSNGDPIPFDETIAQVGVTSVDDGEAFQVAEAGDYLLTYFLPPPDEEQEPRTFGVEVNDAGQIEFSASPASFVVSVPAGGRVSLIWLGGNQITLYNYEGTFTIVRLGDATSSPD